MARKPWAKLPSAWIEAGGLQAFRWSAKGGGANGDNIAALMTLIVLAHHADEQAGDVKLTYDELEALTGLSRPKLARGLELLVARAIVVRGDGRSMYRLTDYDPTRNWGKLPHRALYGGGGRVVAFDDFTLRKAAELNALKLYLLFVARRGEDTNLANISYDKIAPYTGMARDQIKTGLSFLAAQSLAHVERLPSTRSDIGVQNAYRLVGLDSYNHLGTRGRGMDEAALYWPGARENDPF